MQTQGRGSHDPRPFALSAEHTSVIPTGAKRKGGIPKLFALVALASARAIRAQRKGAMNAKFRKACRIGHLLPGVWGSPAPAVPRNFQIRARPSRLSGARHEPLHLFILLFIFRRSQASVDSLIEVIACHDGRRFSISEQDRSRRGAGPLSLAD